MIPNGHILPTKVLAFEPPKQDKILSGGLILPSVAQKDPCIRAKVVKVGDGTDLVPMCVKEGQTIIFSPHVFQRVVIDGEEFKILDVRDVLFYFD